MSIIFEETLSMENYIDKDFINSNNYNYYLFRIIIHKGEINYCHYISLIKLNSEIWLEFNDEQELECYNNILDYNNVYSLFYVKSE